MDARLHLVELTNVCRLDARFVELTNVCGLDARLDLVELMNACGGDERLDLVELAPSSMFRRWRNGPSRGRSSCAVGKLKGWIATIWIPVQTVPGSHVDFNHGCSESISELGRPVP